MEGHRLIRILLLVFVLLCCPLTAAHAEDDEACTIRHAELTKQAANFKSENQIKRLIDADLRRAMREQAEGDTDECIEALDHAAALLAGKY